MHHEATTVGGDDLFQEFVISGILLLGGLGLRFGDETPKQFQKLSGKKVYLHTLERFIRSKLFDEVILVCHPDWIANVEEDLKHYPGHHIRIVPGGETRQASAYNGVKASKSDYVVIHDAVRPFVSHEILQNNIEAAIKYGAVDTCIPSADTLVYTPNNESIAMIPERSHYMRGQTPQSFSRDLILKAHENTPDESSSCECRLVLDQGHHVHVVEGCQQNMKITTLMDLFVAEQILRMKREKVEKADSIDVDGKTYMVTGGTSGIGKAVVEELEKQGATVLPIGRTAEKYRADLTIKSQREELFKKIYCEHGPVDGLINCVGLLTVGPFDAHGDEIVREMIDVNYLAPIDACRKAVLKPGAHIVNLSSSSFFRGRANYALYSSLKAAIVNFTQAYADEHPDLCVNAIVPQRTNTPMRWKNFPGENPTTLLEPLEVANTIINLLSQKETTGTIFEVKKRSPLKTT